MDIKNRDLDTVEHIDDRHAQPILRETALEHAAHSSDLSVAQNAQNPIAGSRHQRRTRIGL